MLRGERATKDEVRDFLKQAISLKTSSISSFLRSLMPLLDIRNLSVSFATRHGAFAAVEGFDLTL